MAHAWRILKVLALSVLGLMVIGVAVSIRAAHDERMKDPAYAEARLAQKSGRPKSVVLRCLDKSVID